MANLENLPHKLDEKEGSCLAVIETPRGGRCKYKYHADAEAFEAKDLLPEGMSFPMDFGFIPSTTGEDGDPIDVLVLFDEPLAVGALVQVRLIGVIAAQQTEGEETVRNDRLIAVAVRSRLHDHLETARDLGEEYLAHLEQFWVQKNDLIGRDFDIERVAGPEAAVAAVKKASH